MEFDPNSGTAEYQCVQSEHDSPSGDHILVALRFSVGPLVILIVLL